MKKTNSIKDIAIIGMSGKFSKSENIDSFWKHLINGKELVTFYDSNELRELGIEDRLIEDPNYIFANSRISNPENFDYSFFGYTKAEAQIMDPQIRLMHEHVWLALEDAGCNPENYTNKIGLYLAASDNINWRAYQFINPTDEVSEFMATRIANKSFISTLISYNLNLRGPSIYVDTACSSSLTSIHLACRSLLMRECSVALAGASSILTTKDLGYRYDEGMVFSKDGHCRTFDKESSGTFFGEGIGVLALKRLEEAIENKDHIYAVIKATALNNDGNAKVGYTAPSVTGQAECIKLAHRIAGLKPEDINYIEAHGTGTKLGDPVEIEALNKAFNYNTNHTCAIGSVKSNIGHLDTVAGIVGVIKTAMVLKTKMLPPSINYNNPNPEINFKSGPFYVNDKLVNIDNKGENIYRAGVSSFGIGGTNGHIVLEEFPLEYPESKQRKEKSLLLLSAKTPEALFDYINKLIDFLQGKESLSLENLAYTLQIGRKHFNCKCFLVADSVQNAINDLKEMVTRPNFLDFNRKKKTVFMFSGGGSQYYKMAYQLYLNEPFFKSVMDEGFEVLKKITGKDARYILGYFNKKIDEDLINEIENMLPILFIVEHGIARLLMHIGIQPDYMIGHSLGEYIAACISGVFTFEDALKIVIKRGELTSKLPEGGMVGVELSSDQVKQYLTNKLSIATINMDDSCVVSGAKEDVEEFIQLLEKESISYTRLKISIAAHSILLEEILDEYKEALNDIKLSSPKIPFISNLSGREVTPEEVTSAEYWVKHLRHTVNFLKGISFILDKVKANYIEIGSGGILTSFLKQNKLFQKENFGINILRHPKESYDDYEYYLKVLGKLWQNGAKIGWEKFNENKNLTKISIPGYAFAKTKLSVKVDPFKQLKNINGLINNKSLNLKNSFYIKNWKKTLPQNKTELKDDFKYCLVCVDGTFISNSILSQVRKVFKVISLKIGEEYSQQQSSYTLNPFVQNHFEQLFNSLDSENIEISRVIYNWNFQGLTNIFKPSIPIMHLCQGLIVNQVLSFEEFTFLGDFGKNILGNEEINVPLILAEKTLKMVLKNNTKTHIRILDINTKEVTTKGNYEFINDVIYHKTDSDIAYRNGQRWIQFYDKLLPITTHSNTLRTGSNYLIINGLSDIGLLLSKHLTSAYQANVIITDHFDRSYDNDQKTEKLLKSLDQLSNSNIHYFTLDPFELNQTQELINRIEHNLGKISGVIFLNKENEISDLSDLNSLIDQQIRKIQPIQNLHSLFQDKELDFIWAPTKLSSEIDHLHENIYSDTYTSLLNEILMTKPNLWISVALDDLYKEPDSSKLIIELFELSVNNQLNGTIISFNNIEDVQNGTIDLHVEEEEESDTQKINSELQNDYVAPQTSLEIKICELWQSYLGFEQIGIEDNFFELGGNSLKAMTILKRIHKEYEVQIILKDFFAKPTVKLLAEEISIAILLAKQQTRKDTKVLKI